MKVKKLLGLIIVCALLLCTASCSGSYKGDSEQVLDNLNIHMDLKENGSMDVTEIWTLDLKDRGKDYRNVYKSFKLDPSKAGDITNVSVYDIDNEKEYKLEDVKDPSQNLNSGLSNICYLYRYGSDVELGLYMPAIESGERNFRFKYTVNDVITVYNDTAVSYYQELGSSFSLPVKHMDCVINLSNNQDKDALRAWLHCTSKSNLSIDSAQRISFIVDELPKETMVETRICMPTNLFPDSTRRINQNQFETIAAEEAKWQSDYEAQLRWQYILGIIDVVGGVIIVALGVLYYVVKRKKNKRFKLEVPEYTRDIPQDQNPGIMSELFYYYKGGINKSRRGKVFSSTILSLAYKKYLLIERLSPGPGSKNKDIFQIRVQPKNGIGELTKSESEFLKLFENVAKANNSVFTMSDFEKYAKTHYNYVDTTVENFFDDNKQACVNRAYMEKVGKESPMKVLGVLGIIAAVVFFVLSGSMVYIPLGIIISSIIVLIGASMMPRLLIDGERMFLTWKGLERFMLEFSRMKEYSTMQLDLWEEYLVYATAMGISDKVCDQLKMVYPQLNDPAYVDTHYSNSLLFWMMMDSRYHGYHNSGMNFGDALAHRIDTISTSATRLAHPPSSSGGSGGGFGGGGFSGGGGGFGGGGGGVR